MTQVLLLAMAAFATWKGMEYIVGSSPKRSSKKRSSSPKKTMDHEAEADEHLEDAERAVSEGRIDEAKLFVTEAKAHANLIDDPKVSTRIRSSANTIISGGSLAQKLKARGKKNVVVRPNPELDLVNPDEKKKEFPRKAFFGKRKLFSGARLPISGKRK